VAGDRLVLKLFHPSAGAELNRKGDVRKVAPGELGALTPAPVSSARPAWCWT
jgi:hypothetical protein